MTTTNDFGVLVTDNNGKGLAGVHAVGTDMDGFALYQLDAYSDSTGYIDLSKAFEATGATVPPGGIINVTFSLVGYQDYVNWIYGNSGVPWPAGTTETVVMAPITGGQSGSSGGSGGSSGGTKLTPPDYATIETYAVVAIIIVVVIVAIVLVIRYRKQIVGGIAKGAKATAKFARGA